MNDGRNDDDDYDDDDQQHRNRSVEYAGLDSDDEVVSANRECPSHSASERSSPIAQPFAGLGGIGMNGFGDGENDTHDEETHPVSDEDEDDDDWEDVSNDSHDTQHEFERGMELLAELQQQQIQAQQQQQPVPDFVDGGDHWNNAADDAVEPNNNMNNNINNNIDNERVEMDFDGDDDGDGDQALPVEEIHWAVNDLLGINGNLRDMFRNAGLVLLYCAVALWITLLLPLKMSHFLVTRWSAAGALISRLAQETPHEQLARSVRESGLNDSVVEGLAQVLLHNDNNINGSATAVTVTNGAAVATAAVVRQWVRLACGRWQRFWATSFVQALHSKSVTATSLCVISLFDLLQVMMGLVGLALLLLLLRALVSLFQKYRLVRTVLDRVNSFVLILKVITLLLFRIFTMPVTLGEDPLTRVFFLQQQLVGGLLIF
jgi:hypothetical protein